MVLLKVAGFFALAGCFFVGVFCESMMSKGKWDVVSLDQCENAEMYEYQFGFGFERLSRTEMQFNVTMDLKEDFHPAVACKIDISKKVDGEYKDYYNTNVDSCLGMAKNVSENNNKRAHEMMGHDREDHMDAGHHELINFWVDFCDFPCEAIKGDYVCKVTMVDQSPMPKGCIQAGLIFRDYNDEAEICPKCKEQDEYDDE